jgi:glutamate-1-semialdehyde 2,1-aminomutase
MADSRVSRPKSHEAFRRAKRLIPGGVNSPARAFSVVGGEPPFIARGRGPHLFDIDGNEYIDCSGARGSMILGHGHRHVSAAIEESLKDGSSFAAPTERETQLAELIIEAVPSIEMLRLVDSGSEAVTSAIRLARGYTGRDMIVRFAGGFHGDVDALMVATGASPVLAGMPACPGISFGATNGTLVLRYNDLAALEAAFSQHGDLIAAVIVEPIATNMGLVPGTPKFLTALREQTQQHESLLIFDEVTTGFRLAYGGAQHVADIEPDITVLGKIIGGGLPAGAFGGRRNLMHRLMPAGPVMQGSNLAGNPLITAAGIATLRELRDHPPYETLEHLGQRLEDGLRDQLTGAGIPHVLTRRGSIWSLFFADRPVGNYDAARDCDTATFTRWFWAMMDRGVYMPSHPLDAAFLSLAHDEGVIDTFLAATGDSLKFMAGFVQ